MMESSLAERETWTGAEGGLPVIPRSGALCASPHLVLCWPEPVEFDRITLLRNRTWVRKWFLDDRLLDYEANRRYLQTAPAALSSGLLVVRWREDGRFLGTMGWSQLDVDQRKAEFGRLAVDLAEIRQLPRPRPHVAREALALLATWAFERMGLVLLYSDVMAENWKSMAVCRRLGMRNVGFHQKQRPDGKAITMARYELTRRDWEISPANRANRFSI